MGLNPTGPDANNPSGGPPRRVERFARVRGVSRGERWFRSLAQNSSDVVMILEADGTVRYVSPAVERVLGYRPEDFVGTLAFDYVHPEDIEHMSKSFAETLQKPGLHPPVEYRVRAADGSWRHVEAIRSNWLDDPHMVGVVANVRDVSERKRAEEALQESEERYRTVVEQSVEAIYLFDAETKRVLESNAAFRRLMGFSEKELLGLRIYDFIDHDHEDIDRHIRRSLKEKRRHIGERRYRRKDGSVIVVDTSASVISYGGRTALCAVSRDVTERRKIEDAVRKSEMRLAEAQRLAHLGGWEWDIQTDEISWSDEVYRIYGLAPQSSVPSYEGFMAVVHPDDRNLVRTTIDKALHGSEPYDVEHRVVRPDGEVRVVHRRAEVIRGEGGEPLRMIGTVHDITDSKRAEEALRESEERYRTVVEEQTELVCCFLPDLTLTFVNDAYCRYFGEGAEELVGGSFLKHIPEEDRVHYEGGSFRLSEENPARTVEHRVLTPDAGVCWQQWTIRAIFDAEGNILEYQSVGRDVTERRKTEDALKRSEASLAESQRIAHLGTWEWDVVTGEVWLSEETYRIHGFDPGEGVNLLEKIEEALFPEDLPRYRGKIDETLSGEAEHYDHEHRIRRPDGEVRWVHGQAEVVRDEGGEPLRMIGTVHDVTERKVLEDRLRHQAFHDALTGLPNRQLFLDRLGHTLARMARRRNRRVAVLFMDLDNFKVVNDSLGHETGDRLLVFIANRLKRCLRSEDTLARFGGDEFTVLLEDVEGPGEPVRVAERIIEVLRDPFVLDGREVYARASIGITIGEDHTTDADDLLRNADTAMYRAKEEDPGRFFVFDPAMHEQVLGRLELENGLRHILENG